MEVATYDAAGVRQLRRAWCRAWEKVRGLAATARVLLQAIYRRLGEHLHCWPSQQTLAQDTGLSERSVRRWLPRLEEAGWIRRSKRITQRGQITDLIQITVPEQEVPLRLRGGQIGRPSPDKLSAEKDSEEKASEASSEAAGAAADRAMEAPRAEAPTLGYVRGLLSLWKELVRQPGDRPAPLPDPGLLGHYSAAELQTALAVLLVRMRRRVRSPKGLFLRILEATHRGEREPRAYSAAELRRIAQGALPEHARGVRRRQDHPVPPEAELLPEAELECEAGQPPAAELEPETAQPPGTRLTPGPGASPSGSSSPGASSPGARPASERALAILEGTDTQAPGVLEHLVREVEDIFLAARLLAQRWGWQESVAFGELHRTKEALLAGGVL